MMRLIVALPVLGVMLLAGCGKPPQMPARLTDEEKAQGKTWDNDPTVLADPLQDQAPGNHMPVERWRTHHFEYINSGLVTEQRCMTCHQPDTYCNRCHEYVGAKRVVAAPTPASEGG